MKRTFIIGSEWLYYKIYVGTKTADRILVEAIKPVSEQLLKQKVIDSWFFIRYGDPKLHLRVRFHFTESLQFEPAIKFIHNILTPFIETKLIWKVATDTYNRELERYGFTLIDKAERLFFNESVMITEILNLIEGDEGEIIRWLIGLRAIDETLDTFGYTEDRKLEYLGKLRDAFGTEFGMNKDMKQQLSNKYRMERMTIEKILNRNNDENSDLAPLFELLRIKCKETNPIAKELIELERNNAIEIPLDALMNSYLHMMVNRLFKSKQRLHELVLYDLLCQYYSSQSAQKKQVKRQILTQ